jgi:hypothetical protein
MSAEPTWDNVEASIAPPADTGVEGSDTPEVEPTPVEAEAEIPAEVVAAPSGDAIAGEDEAQPEADTEDDEETHDPPEIQALPSRSAQRRQARRERVERLEAESEPARKFRDPTEPISSFSEDLESMSQSRYGELCSDIFKNHGDQYLVGERYRETGLTAEEIDAVVQKAAAAKQSGTLDTAPADPNYDPYEDSLIPDDVKERLRKADELERQFGEVKSKVEGFETKEQERKRLADEAQVRAIEDKVFQTVFPVVAEAVKEYGLEENKDDPPLIAGLKEAGRELLVSNVDPVFMEDEDNRKAVDRVKHWASKKEEANALREADPLKVRSRSAAEKIRQMPKLDAILSAIQQLSEKKAEKIEQRGKGQPPVPASAPSGGSVIPKTDIKSWDDALASVGQ